MSLCRSAAACEGEPLHLFVYKSHYYHISLNVILNNIYQNHWINVCVDLIGTMQMNIAIKLSSRVLVRGPTPPSNGHLTPLYPILQSQSSISNLHLLLQPVISVQPAPVRRLQLPRSYQSNQHSLVPVRCSRSLADPLPSSLVNRPSLCLPVAEPSPA